MGGNGQGGTRTAPLTLAIIGCGAIAEAVHLPAIARSQTINLVALVDTVLPRAEQLAEQHGVSIAVADYHDVLDSIDAAIVAVPNHLHAPIALDLLAHGVHVLVEKPLALNTRDCDAMIAAAEETGLVLATGLMYRFYESSRFIKHILDEEWLGRITNVDLRQGTIYRWSPLSDFQFRKEAAGGGVLIDIGIHILDLLLWWLGDVDTFAYQDDAMDGIEANCELYLTMTCGASGTVELSRMRDLRNTCILSGERGTVEVGTWGFNPPVRLHVPGTELTLASRVTQGDGEAGDKLEIFSRQLDDFAAAILERRDPFVSGREGRTAVDLIERCYANRQPLRYPWLRHSADAPVGERV